MYGLTPREEQIMNTIWNMDHPCLISEILKASPALKRNTVAPALVVLENKSYLKVDSIGKSYTRTGKAYVAAISKEAYKEQQAFLNAISQIIYERLILFQSNAQTKSAELVKQYVKRLWYAWSRHRITLDNSLVSL